MNLYVRYFDHETLAKNVDEAVAFLEDIEDIKVESNTANRIMTFLNSSNLYPFRLKVSYSNYVLFLKTEAQTLAEFKEEEARRKEQRADRAASIADRKKTILDALNEQKEGWWEAGLTFKRVMVVPETGKCKYIDTPFRVRLRANSAIDAYNRIVDHLQNRPDVDPRSQLPSAKSEKFEYKFLGNDEPAAKAPDAPAEQQQAEA